MTQQEYDRRLAELEAKADEAGCCIIPATPIPPPDGGSPGTARPTEGKGSR